MTDLKILVFSGPSGGHLFPAQAFAEAFQESKVPAQIILVTSIRAEGLCAQFPAGLFSEIVYLPEFGSPAGLSFSGIQSVLRIPAAMIQSWNLISRIRPDLCVGFGSFVSYFGMLFSAWRGIPTIIHEQNQVPGKATRMLQGSVRQIAVSFPETQFRRTPSNVIVTGLPIRAELRQNITPPDQKPPHPFTVLVCGGSQGSAFLNRAVLKSFSCLSAEERAQFAVIHITGNGQENEVARGYADLGISAEVYPFFERMQLLYNRAHMAISRAGANSSFEQALYGIPTVFIPYPHAEGHQNDNARYFVENGGAVMLNQDDQAAQKIASLLSAWSQTPEYYWLSSRRMSTLANLQGHVNLFDAAYNMLKLN